MSHIDAVRRWQKANPEKVKEINERYRKTTKAAETRQAAAKRYRDKNLETVRESNRRRRKANPEMRRAHDRVRLALKAGKLKRGPCEREGEDCRGDVQAHHDDYARPLDVRWLCRRHHVAVHAEQQRKEVD